MKIFISPFTLIGLCFLALFLVFPTKAVILEWDPNSETNLAGYKVYYGLASRNYTWTNQVNAPLTTAIVTNLQPNRRYFFAVTAFDTDGLESEYSDEVSTTVTDGPASNSVPVVIPDVVQALEDQPRSIVLTGTDADADTLHLVVMTLPLHGRLAGAAPNLIYTPDPDFNGIDGFQFIATDGRANSAPATMFIVVNAVNDPPTLDAIANLSVNEDSGARVVNLSGISSGGSGEVQPLTVTATSSNPNLIPNPLVSYFSPDSAGILAFAPVANGWGTAIITVTVSDGQSVNKTFRRFFYVTVNPVNDPPIVSAGADQAVSLGATAMLAGSATDDGFPNPPRALTMSWSKLNGPGTVTFSAPGSVISTASFSQPGQYVLRLRASDGLLSATDDVRVSVSEQALPVISDLAIAPMDARTIMVSLRTDEPAVCSIEFGTTSLGATNVETTLATDHVMVLTNLFPGTNYLVRIRAVDVVGQSSVTETFTVATPPVALMAWAADAGELVAPMSIASTALGAFVWSPRNNEGSVSFDFQLPIASQYRVWCQLRTYAPDTGSFYVSIDGSAEFVFDAAGSEWLDGWRWIAVNDVTSGPAPENPWLTFLSEGRHRLVFRAHEAVTLLHQVVLTNDPDWIPQ